MAFIPSAEDMKHSGFQLFANCNQLNRGAFCCPGLCYGRRQAEGTVENRVPPALPAYRLSGVFFAGRSPDDKQLPKKKLYFK